MLGVDSRLPVCYTPTMSQTPEVGDTVKIVNSYIYRGEDLKGEQGTVVEIKSEPAELYSNGAVYMVSCCATGPTMPIKAKDIEKA